VLVHGIGAVAEPIFQSAVGGLARGLEDPAINVEQPAVIAAADTLVGDQTELKRGSTMRAVWLQQADGAALVTENDEILPKDAQSPGQFAQLAGQDDRLPEAPRYSPQECPVRRGSPRLPPAARDDAKPQRHSRTVLFQP
jgi:hypothetical protein